MTLIEEIQREAVDSKSDLGALLRKCKLLAARLGSRPLEDWLLWESSGYPEDADVPEYRMWPLELKGHFAGPFGSGIRNASIPMICIPEKLREPFMNYKCRQSVASIEEILKKADSGTLQVCTGDLAVMLGSKVYQHQNCMQAWAEFGVGSLIELLNTVRNRVLDFSLAVWKEAPGAGETTGGKSQVIEPERVTQIFNTTVYGGAANLVGSANNAPVTFNVSQGDFASLEKVLQDNGVKQEDIQQLREAVQMEGTPPHSGGGFGPRVSSWVAKMIKKAAQGTWQVGISAAGKLLADGISRYYGM